jgi:G:T-mismatch repair DNA endonuclease (very short patch repair protein)
MSNRIYMIDEELGSAICYLETQRMALEAVGYRVCTMWEYREREEAQRKADRDMLVSKLNGTYKATER